MKVSLNWLSEYVDLPHGTEALCDLLTFAGVEVEKIERRGAAFPNVVVAQILSSEQHPNADRLSVCQVDDGSGSPRQIVCGAKNYKVGDKVPLALPGAILPGDFKIKVGKLRGVESQGMLCSARELEMAEDADGLLILSPEAKVGSPISDVFPADTVLEIEVTPNRTDLLGYLGIAREVGALTGKPIRKPQITLGPACDGDPVPVQVADDSLCPLYTARKIAGVKVGPSPEWLVQRLESVGLRPINNIVDITNFVLLETGQPLHAFDAAKLSGGIVVRTASAGEKFHALDGKTYLLSASDIVIADAETPVAIAGVMGGEESGVTQSTTDIVLESAEFAGTSVRRASRSLMLASDSSYRFERGVDGAGVVPASERATALILELAGGTLAAPLTVVGNTDADSRTVTLRYSRCRALAGADIPTETIDSTLVGFGLERIGRGNTGGEDLSIWRIPSFRPDLAREVDLIEEVTRVYGLETVPEGHTRRFAPESEVDRVYDFRMRLSRNLAGLGFQEIRTPTLISEKALADSIEPRDPVERVRNPLGEDQSVLRPDLAPALLAVAARNLRYGAENLRLFEVGKIYGGNPEEEEVVALLMTGSVRPGSWRDGESRVSDLHDLAGVLGALGLRSINFARGESECSPLKVELRTPNSELAGYMAVLAPSRARELDFREPVVIAQVRVAALRKLAEPAGFKDWPRYPSVSRDVALVAPLKLSHAEVKAVIDGTSKGAVEPLLESVKIFDVFEDPTGEKVAIGHRSLAYSLTYRSSERTLTVDEVNDAHRRVRERLKAELPVTLRE